MSDKLLYFKNINFIESEDWYENYFPLFENDTLKNRKDLIAQTEENLDTIIAEDTNGKLYKLVSVWHEGVTIEPF